jgi:uncharacterized protein YbgA (DUF1722 family)
MSARPPKDEIRIGISSCLLGHKVRYDGGHKKDSLVTGVLSQFMTFVPVCPEVEVGMPVPRPAVRLVRLGSQVRFVDPRHGVDHTEAMSSWSEAYRALGPLVARAKQLPRRGESRYGETYMHSLRALATKGKNVNVLLHMAGYFKDQLGLDEKAELHDLIADYRRGLVPLVVPLTLIRHYVRRYRSAYLEGQAYLEPHPKELMLRNHVQTRAARAHSHHASGQPTRMARSHAAWARMEGQSERPATRRSPQASPHAPARRASRGEPEVRWQALYRRATERTVAVAAGVSGCLPDRSSAASSGRPATRSPRKPR